MTQPLRTTLVGGASCLAVALVLGAGPAAGQSEPEPIESQAISDRHAFADGVSVSVTLDVEGLEQAVVDLEDASNLLFYEFTVQPGTWFPWHTHPATALVAVREGELVYIYAEDCVERPYAAGAAFVDPGHGNVHTAYNPSDEAETSVITAFIGAPDEGDLTVPVGEEEAAALDEACGIERGAG